MPSSTPGPISLKLEEGGCVLSSAIDKYIFVSVKERFDEKLRVGYTQTEMVDSVDDYVKYSVADLEFHFAVVKASKNDLFITLMNAVKEHFHYYLEELNRVFGIIDISLQGHRDQYEAIKNKDAAKVKELIAAGMAENRRKMEIYRKQFL